MKTIQSKIVLLHLALILSHGMNHISAQDILNSTDNGYSYNIPTGWDQAGTENGAISYTKGGDNNHIMIVSPHQFTTVQQAMQESDQPQQIGELLLSLQGNPQNYGSNGVIAQYIGEAQGTYITLQAITLVSPHGGGAVVIGISASDSPSADLLMACKSLANSMRFSKPLVSTLAIQWTQSLRGKQLIYLNTSNGLSQKSSYDLCSDGSFYHSSDESYSSNTFTDSFNSNITGNGHGTWRVTAQGQQVNLLFSFKDGTSRQFTITTDADYLYLNGVKYFRQAAQNCE